MPQSDVGCALLRKCCRRAACGLKSRCRTVSPNPQPLLQPHDEGLTVQSLAGAGVRVNAARVGLVMQESSKEKWSVDYRSRSTSKEEKGAEVEGKGRGAWHLYGGILC